MQADDWLCRRLDNWARWLTEGNRGTLGYPRQQAFARQMRVSVTADTAHIPVDDVEARGTHEAVEQLRRVGLTHLWLVLHCRWVGDPRVPDRVRRPLGVRDTAAAMCVGESTVHAHVKKALPLVRAHLDAAQRGFTP